MSQPRLTTAAEQGAFGAAATFVALRPNAGTDLSALPREATTVVTGFRPDHDDFARAGWQVAAAAPNADCAVVSATRSKTLARALVAEAAARAWRVVVDGQKTDGIDALFKECRARLGDLPSVTKAHGRTFWFDATDAFADWALPAPARGPQGFFAQAGVFSEEGVDPASALLAAALPDKLGARVADLGAGWGYLASVVLRHAGVTAVDLYEAEALALDCARLNITDPRATFHWADVTTMAPEARYDAVVMNPPFHRGRVADPALGRAFIATARRLLKPGGQLWMVANRQLPYETALDEAFRQVQHLGGDGRFKLFHATRPRA